MSLGPNKLREEKRRRELCLYSLFCVFSAFSSLLAKATSNPVQMASPPGSFLSLPRPG
jgi:hypothetical protein